MFRSSPLSELAEDRPLDQGATERDTIEGRARRPLALVGSPGADDGQAGQPNAPAAPAPRSHNPEPAKTLASYYSVVRIFPLIWRWRVSDAYGTDVGYSLGKARAKRAALRSMGL
jgi:hypothetical protein